MRFRRKKNRSFRYVALGLVGACFVFGTSILALRSERSAKVPPTAVRSFQDPIPGVRAFGSDKLLQVHKPAGETRVARPKGAHQAEDTNEAHTNHNNHHNNYHHHNNSNNNNNNSNNLHGANHHQRGDEALAEAHLAHRRFNQLGLARQIKDTRAEACAETDYPLLQSASMLTVSIVMCFYNETPALFLRSLQSVLARTPVDLLDEIIVVDDFNYDGMRPGQAVTATWVRSLEYPKVRVVSNTKREGLIRSRLAGAAEVKSPALVFLDSHIEVNEHWLQPLLAPLVENYRAVTVPICDLIDLETGDLTAGPWNVVGTMKWSLQFAWEKLDKRTLDPVALRPSPIMVGGLFAITKRWWIESGSYDDGMDIWGGENIEMSLRHWMCGGTIQIAPCSRIGHVFRKKFVFGFPGGASLVVNRNRKRAAEVWLDEPYLSHFYKNAKRSMRDLEPGDVSKRKALRERLQCHSFEWYLSNINPALKDSYRPQNQSRR